jgi:hypothetical protein
MGHPLVYAMTLSWNRQAETLACLRSMRQLRFANKRLLLVDNGSRDGTPESVGQTMPNVEIIVNERNRGFAAGCNRGIRHALRQGADYVLLLNNDTEIDQEALGHLIDLSDAGVGITAPKIYYADEPTRIWSVGGKRHPLTLEKTGDARGEIDRGQWEEVLERDYVVGCAMLLSQHLLTKVGLFDERFFMYYEDSDLCLRGRQAGFRILLAPQAHVWHKVATSSGGTDSPNERYWMARSSVLFFHKHVRGARWSIVLPYRTASAIKTTLRLLCNGKSQAARAYLRGLQDGLAETRKLG